MQKTQSDQAVASATPGRPRLERSAMKRAASESSSAASVEPPVRRSKRIKRNEPAVTSSSGENQASSSSQSISTAQTGPSIDSNDRSNHVLQAYNQVLNAFSTVLDKLNDANRARMAESSSLCAEHEMFLRYVELDLLDAMRTGINNMASNFRREDYLI